MDFRYPGRLFTPAGFIFFMAVPGIVPLRFGRGRIYSYIRNNYCDERYRNHSLIDK